MIKHILYIIEKAKYQIRMIGVLSNSMRHILAMNPLRQLHLW